MPGLLRGVARTAAIAGTATAVSNRVSRRQASRWAAQEQPQDYGQQPAAPQPVQAAPQPAAPDAGDKLELLKQLGDLKASGVLTDAEFEQQKAEILAQ
jgi:hypothetical protein